MEASNNYFGENNYLANQTNLWPITEISKTAYTSRALREAINYNS